ncbi:MAG TPA: GNAT family N-acetyltransferase [Caulobacteraceae bacterium]|jgi:RimJ/RimL family protein N-acetyltransferase|nr:GNAT family N-acetyltransferase [Caulobacteraceae bacterium]
MRVFLETDRLLLRCGVESDAGLLHELDGDPEVMRYLSGGRATAWAVIEGEVLPRFLGPEARRWIAVEKGAGDFIGWFALEGSGEEGELGYRLRRPAWGRGYASEGARALVDKGFAELGLMRIWGQTMAVNTASRRVMEKAGLVYGRTFHLEWDDPIAGAEHGEVEYALTRAEWLTAAPCRDGGHGE